MLALALMTVISSHEKGGTSAPERTSLQEVRRRLLNPQTALRMSLFVVTLSAVLFAAALGATPLVGALGAAPLLPLFGLFALSKNDSLSALHTVGRTVVLGPIVAMAFVMGFSAIVEHTNPVLSSAILLFGWGLSLLAIWLISALVLRLSERV